jgi:hypothetical protein
MSHPSIVRVVCQSLQQPGSGLFLCFFQVPAVVTWSGSPSAERQRSTRAILLCCVETNTQPGCHHSRSRMVSGLSLGSGFWPNAWATRTADTGRRIRLVCSIGDSSHTFHWGPTSGVRKDVITVPTWLWADVRAKRN